MKCGNCPFYSSGYQWNGCGVLETEYFQEQQDCDLVNDDGTINYDASYFDNRVDKPVR